jgi:uncharacterized protein YdaU (DUF1376 family)
MNWYKHYIGDFQRDTGHLSLTERGAYRAMLDHHYATEKPLPKEVMAICRLVGAQTKAERDAVQRVLSEFWNETTDGWTNDRALKEITKASKQRDTNREIAEERERNRRAERIDDEPSDEGPHEPSTNRETNRSTKEAIRARVPDSRLQTKNSVPNGTAALLSPDKALFDYGKQVLGKNSGGLVNQLKTAFGIEGAYKLLREASEKSNPREWLGAVLARTKPGSPRAPAIDVTSAEYQELRELERKRALGETA